MKKVKWLMMAILALLVVLVVIGLVNMKGRKGDEEANAGPSEADVEQAIRNSANRPYTRPMPDRFPSNKPDGGLYHLGGIR